MPKEALRHPSNHILRGHNTDDPTRSLVVTLNQDLEGCRWGALGKDHQSTKVKLSAELGNRKGNDGPTVNAKFHDMSSMARDVKQAL